MAVAIIALSYVLYRLIGFKSGMGVDNQGVQMITYAKKQHFHPDSILEINWVAYDKVFNFNRPNRLGAWKNNLAEIANPRQINDRLVFLASSNYFPLDKIKDSIITARIKLDNHEVWEFESNGHLLRWISGPLSGKGGKLGQKAKDLFLTGRYSFSDLNVSWCNERPREFIKDNIKLAQKNGRWLKHTKKEQIHTELSDSTFVEKWIGKNCYIKTERVFDSALVKLKDPKFINVKFSKSTKRVSWDNSGLIEISGDSSYIIRSNELKVDLERLEGKLN